MRVVAIEACPACPRAISRTVWLGRRKLCRTGVLKTETTTHSTAKEPEPLPKSKSVGAKPKTTIRLIVPRSQPTPTWGLTKSTEILVGRFAMLGWIMALAGEAITGKGALAQLGYRPDLPTFEIDFFIVFLIGFNLVAAVLPSSGLYGRDTGKRTRQQAQDSDNDFSFTLFDHKVSFGVHEFGFTKENELFVGRVAQLGFAVGLIGEITTGKGPLAQVFGGAASLHSNLGLVVFVLFMILLAVNEGSGKAMQDSADDDEVF